MIIIYSRLIALVISLLLAGCVTVPKTVSSSLNFNASSLTVDLNSNGRTILDAVPVESAMDRFETIDPQGRTISYVAFADTDVGALVFIDQKLYGTLSHHDAQAFYTCRGYATVAHSHWAVEATEWSASLLASSKPANEVKLEFSGKPSGQSIKEAAESPFLKKIKSLIGMGSNPLNIVNSLSSARNDYEVGAEFDKATKGLSLISPGMSVSHLDEVMKPEEISFTGDGMVMAYPSHLVEYYVAEGRVKVIQQPSFYYLAKTHAALFYAPNAQWASCTPKHWKDALPEKLSTRP